MSHYPMPVLDQSRIDQYMQLFRGDETIAQPEAASFEYIIAMMNLWRLNEAVHNVSLVAIEKMPPDVLDFFVHKDFNSGAFAMPDLPFIEDAAQVELVGNPAWELM